jgi:signal transduction histidine kinase
MEVEATDFDLPGAIDNALTLVRERAGRRGITLGREIDERVGTIRGDERKVKPVVLNLLSNAIKLTPEGGRIDVRAAVNGDMVEVSVAGQESGRDGLDVYVHVADAPQGVSRSWRGREWPVSI